VLACAASHEEAEAVAGALAADGLDRTHDIAVVRFNDSGARLWPLS
jgi:hypothetical protein